MSVCLAIAALILIQKRVFCFRHCSAKETRAGLRLGEIPYLVLYSEYEVTKRKLFLC